MTTNAEDVQPRLGWNFLIEVEGLDVAYAQAVTLPDDELESTEVSMGGQSYNNKVATGYKIGDIVIEKIKPIDGADQWAIDWLRSAIDPRTQRIGVPREYKKVVTFHELDNNGSPIETSEYKGCWVKKVGRSKYDATSKSDKVLETVTMSVDARV